MDTDSSIKDVSSSELDNMLTHDQPVVVLYSLENDADMKMARILGRIARDRGEAIQFALFKLNDKKAGLNGITISGTH